MIVLSVVLQIAAFAAPFQIQLVIDEAVFHADQDLLAVLALAFGALVIIQARSRRCAAGRCEFSAIS